MPTMTINIVNDEIDLIYNWTDKANGDVTYTKFFVKTTDGANLTVDFTRRRNSPSDFQFPKIDVGNGYEDITNDTWTGVAPSGWAVVRFELIDPIKPEVPCNGGTVTVTDNTNLESETRGFERCRTV